MLFDQKIIQHIKKLSEESRDIHDITKGLLSFLNVPKIKVSGNPIPKGPLLVVSNHPGVFDSLALVSTISRKDIQFIALSTYALFGQQVKNHLLPIYRKRKLNHRLYEYPLWLQATRKIPPTLSTKEIKNRNKDSIKRAANLLDIGSAVIIFPAGSAGKKLPNSQWKAGIGYLINLIINPLTKVIFAKIEGTKQKDIFAYMRPLIRKMFFRPNEITIDFSKPFILRQLIGGINDPKIITKVIEEKYNQYFS